MTESKPHLLDRLPVCKDVFKGDIKLAHVILAETILIPADGFKKQAIDASHGKIERLVPLGVESLGYDGCSLARVADGDD